MKGSRMKQTTPWAQASQGVYERLYRGDLWSLRYQMGRGVWERQGPFPNRLLWVDAAPGLETAQRVTDDLINRFYGVVPESAPTDVMPRGLDHASALGLVRMVHRQATASHAMLESRTHPWDREGRAMADDLSEVLKILSRWVT